LPWIGLSTRKRDASTLQRGEVIEKYIGIDSGSVMDIGSNLGEHKKGGQICTLFAAYR